MLQKRQFLKSALKSVDFPTLGNPTMPTQHLNHYEDYSTSKGLNG